MAGGTGTKATGLYAWGVAPYEYNDRLVPGNVAPYPYGYDPGQPPNANYTVPNTVTANTPVRITTTFTYAGAFQYWTVPSGVTSVDIVIAGAAGGGAGGGGGSQGHVIAFTVEVPLVTQFQFYVGQRPTGQAGGLGYTNGGAGGTDSDTGQLHHGFGGGGSTWVSGLFNLNIMNVAGIYLGPGLTVWAAGGGGSIYPWQGGNKHGGFGGYPRGGDGYCYGQDIDAAPGGFVGYSSNISPSNQNVAYNETTGKAGYAYGHDCWQAANGATATGPGAGGISNYTSAGNGFQGGNAPTGTGGNGGSINWYGNAPGAGGGGGYYGGGGGSDMYGPNHAGGYYYDGTAGGGGSSALSPPVVDINKINQIPNYAVTSMAPLGGNTGGGYISFTPTIGQTPVYPTVTMPSRVFPGTSAMSITQTPNVGTTRPEAGTSTATMIGALTVTGGATTVVNASVTMAATSSLVSGSNANLVYFGALTTAGLSSVTTAGIQGVALQPAGFTFSCTSGMTITNPITPPFYFAAAGVLSCTSGLTASGVGANPFLGSGTLAGTATATPMAASGVVNTIPGSGLVTGVANAAGFGQGQTVPIYASVTMAGGGAIAVGGTQIYLSYFVSITMDGTASVTSTAQVYPYVLASVQMAASGLLTGAGSANTVYPAAGQIIGTATGIGQNTVTDTYYESISMVGRSEVLAAIFAYVEQPPVTVLMTGNSALTIGATTVQAIFPAGGGSIAGVARLSAQAVANVSGQTGVSGLLGTTTGAGSFVGNASVFTGSSVASGSAAFAVAGRGSGEPYYGTLTMRAVGALTAVVTFIPTSNILLRNDSTLTVAGTVTNPLYAISTLSGTSAMTSQVSSIPLVYLPAFSLLTGEARIICNAQALPNLAVTASLLIAGAASASFTVSQVAYLVTQCRGVSSVMVAGNQVPISAGIAILRGTSALLTGDNAALRPYGWSDIVSTSQVRTQVAASFKQPPSILRGGGGLVAASVTAVPVSVCTPVRMTFGSTFTPYCDRNIIPVTFIGNLRFRGLGAISVKDIYTTIVTGYPASVGATSSLYVSSPVTVANPYIVNVPAITATASIRRLSPNTAPVIISNGPNISGDAALVLVP